MILFENKKDCCGCSACYNICPKSAITMETDETGFVYPSIDKSRCIDCGACKRVCDFQKNEIMSSDKKLNLVYGAAIKDIDLKKKSASGGVFAQIAKSCIENGGVVYGAAKFQQENKLCIKHIGVFCLDDLEKIQGSKYVHSIIGDAYKKAQQDLIAGKDVVFSGTPCQIAGLKSFLNKDYSNLLTVDIVCHGVPSQSLFHDYIKMLEEEKRIKITDFSFRDKTAGWGHDAKYTYKKNNKQYEKRLYYKLSSYYNLYLQGAICRENCYSCKYACPDRVSDITLGDFWGIEKNQPESLTENGGPIDEHTGVSCCLVNTERGRKAFESLSSEIEIVKTTFDIVTKQNTNLIKPLNINDNRETIISIYLNKGYKAIDDWYWKRVGIKKYYYWILAIAPRSFKKKLRILLKKKR